MEDVVAAISRLDGDSRNLLILKLPDCSISIGGGVGGAYVAHDAVGADEAFYNLIDPRRSPSEFVDLRVGGQEGSYPASYIVNHATVTEAAAYFIRNGTMSPNVTWQFQQ